LSGSEIRSGFSHADQIIQDMYNPASITWLHTGSQAITSF